MYNCIKCHKSNNKSKSIFYESPMFPNNRETEKYDRCDYCNWNQKMNVPLKFYNCVKCGKKNEYYILRYKLINGKKIPDMDGRDGSAIFCKYCKNVN